MSNPIPDFPIIIKTSIQSIMKHPKNSSPSSKRNTKQDKSHSSHTLVKQSFELPSEHI